MSGPGNISGLPNMLPKIPRQSFWVVFVPLLLAAGLFWMGELRGYRAEMSILILPKTDLAHGAAANLVALAHGTAFVQAVYADELSHGAESPITGKTSAEIDRLWKKEVAVRLIGSSDVVRIAAFGNDQDEALTLSKAVAVTLVRTASRYYNQKTDIDVRIVSDPVALPSLTAWPRFTLYTVGTALFFTALFFTVYSITGRIFPKRLVRQSVGGEYVISPETFKPKKPAYWDREEPVSHSEQAVFEDVAESSDEAQEIFDDIAPTVESALVHAEEPVSQTVDLVAPEIVPEEWSVDSSLDNPIFESSYIPEEHHSSYAAERAAQDEEAAGYVSHAAAPDNLPIVDGPITPLQGAQSRLMKADIDAAMEARAQATDPEILEELSKPQTHEPTPEEYRRRLNELLSGKM